MSEIHRVIQEEIQPLRFIRGPRALFVGMSWLFKHPKFLFLGIIPALVSSLILLSGFIVLVITSGSIVSFVDPWVSDLDPWLAGTIKLAVQSGIIALAGVLAYVLFAAIALAIGDPIYSKIAETVDAEAGHETKTSSWIIGVKDVLILLLKGLGIAILAFLLGLIPLVGSLMAFIVTWTFVPFFLSEELLGRTLIPKNIAGHRKSKLLLKDGRTVWGFGVTCQLLFTIPIVQILTMPSAVAGAAILANELFANEYPAKETKTTIDGGVENFKKL